MLSRAGKGRPSCEAYALSEQLLPKILLEHSRRTCSYSHRAGDGRGCAHDMEIPRRIERYLCGQLMVSQEAVAQRQWLLVNCSRVATQRSCDWDLLVLGVAVCTVLRTGQVQVQPRKENKRYPVTRNSYYIVPGETVFVGDKAVSTAPVPTVCVAIDKPKVSLALCLLFDWLFGWKGVTCCNLVEFGDHTSGGSSSRVQHSGNGSKSLPAQLDGRD